MIACVIKRKEDKYDIVLLDENREVQDIFEVRKVEFYEDMTAFEKTLPEKYFKVEVWDEG